MIMFVGVSFTWNVLEERQVVQAANSTVTYYISLGLIVQMVGVCMKRNQGRVWLAFALSLGEQT